MDDEDKLDNVASQKENDILPSPSRAEQSQQKDVSQPKTSDDVVNAGEITEDVDAAAAADEGLDEEKDSDSDDFENLSHRIDRPTELHASEQQKTGMISGF